MSRRTRSPRPTSGGCRRGEILVDDVRRDRPGVRAVGGSLEPPLLPAAQAVLAHQPRRATPPDGEAVILQFARHARTAIGAVRQRECRADMRQHLHVVTPTPAGGSVLPGEIAALADAEHAAKTVDREILFRPIDELESHPSVLAMPPAWLRFLSPSRAKKRSPASICHAPAGGFRSPAEGASTRQPYPPAALYRVSPPDDPGCG